MKEINMSDRKRFRFPKLRMPRIKIDFWQEGANKKVAGYKMLVILLGFIILVLVGQIYGDTIKNGGVSVGAKENVSEVFEDDRGEEAVEVQDKEQDGNIGTEEKAQEVESKVVDDRTDFERVEKIYSFTQEYRGSRIDSAYFLLLKKECNADPDLLQSIVAISVAESGMGRDLPNRNSNFWGWFKGGNRQYDPSREVMAKEICTGIEKYYGGIKDSWALIAKYTGNDRASNWYRNYMWAYNQMEVE